jgi:hypothetical protein
MCYQLVSRDKHFFLRKIIIIGLLIHKQKKRITKLRENCGKEFEAHWQCLEKNNQELYACRTPERTFNTCVFEKLVS